MNLVGAHTYTCNCMQKHIIISQLSKQHNCDQSHTNIHIAQIIIVKHDNYDNL